MIFTFFILFIGNQCYNIIFNSILFIFNIYICENDIHIHILCDAISSKKNKNRSKSNPLNLVLNILVKLKFGEEKKSETRTFPFTFRTTPK